MRSTGFRYLSAALAVLWLSVIAASGLHGIFSSHEHHFCDEHEAFEEGPALAVGSDVAATADPGSPAALRGSEPHEGRSHFACPWANLGRFASKLWLDPRPSEGAFQQGSERRIPSTASPLVVSGLPLSVAPKTSPPV